LELLIHFRNHFTASGWGRRRLTPTELVSAFGFSPHLIVGGLEQISFREIVPIQILVSILTSYLSSHQPLLKCNSTLQPASFAIVLDLDKDLDS
jgi:hypothetical protein